MAAYTYKVVGLVNAPAQEVGELLERLQNSEKGLTPSSLLEASREEGTLLHNEFEWDDSKAAEKYRLQQARSIIQNVAVEITTDRQEQEKERAFVITPGYKSAYVSLNSALTNASWREHLLKEAKRDLGEIKAKYRRLTELAGVLNEIEKFEQGA